VCHNLTSVYGNRYNGIHNYERIRLMQWVRLEERWARKIENADEMAEGYNFNFRIRYNFFFQVPITKKAYEKGSLCFVVNDELMVNFGKQIVYNYFDQNRACLPGYNTISIRITIYS
jgi:hypothetical protein